MARTKNGVNYQGLAFAKPFIEEIKNHIKPYPQYRSVTDFVRQATREKMERMKTKPNNKIKLHSKYKVKIQ